MGDADVTTRDGEGMAPDEMTQLLDALDNDLTHLNATLRDLGRQTINTLSIQMRGYEEFRHFILAINCIILPVLVVTGLCYSLQEMVMSEAAQVILHSVVVFLLLFAASLGVPLYLGTLWAIYHFSVPDDETFGELSSLMTGDESNDSFIPSIQTSGDFINETDSDSEVNGYLFGVPPDSEENVEDEMSLSSEFPASQNISLMDLTNLTESAITRQRKENQVDDRTAYQKLDSILESESNIST